MQTYLKSKPAILQLLLFLGIACGALLIIVGLGGALVSALTGIPLREMGGDYPGRDPQSVVSNLRWMVLLQDIGLFVMPSLAYARFADPHPQSYLGLRLPPRASFWLLAIAALLVSTPLVEWTGVLNQKIVFPPALANKIREMQDSATHAQKLMLADRSIGNLLVNILFIGVFAGIGEELFFRGVVQRILIKGFRSPWAGIIVTAAFFSFFHFEFYGFVPRLLLGILLGAAYWYSGSIWVSMLAHALFNTLQLIAAWFHPELMNDATGLNLSATALLPAAIGSAVLTVLVVLVMKRHSNARFDTVYAGELKSVSQQNELPI